MNDQRKENSLLIDESDKTLNKLRSFIFKMNAKPDSITRAFSKPVKINLEEIYYLNNNIIEKLRMHCKENNLITRITINYDNHRTYEYELFEKFENESLKKAEHVESITIKWDFMVNMPQYELPQPHSLVVKISSGLSFAEYMNLMVSGNFENINEVTIMDSTVLARVEFVNTLLGEELLNVVSNWVKSCGRNNFKCSKFLLLLRKHRNLVATCIENLTNIVSFLFIFILLSYYTKMNITTIADITPSFISNMIIIIGIAYVLIFICKKISHIIAKKIFDNLTDYGEGYVFEITSGDKQRNNEQENLNKKLGIKLIFKFSITIILNISYSLISSIIFSKILF